ncbi:hypothetical protein [Phyllobacterium chamaecytisi]|uniref:hypothetical protein n=1 Tax=Phyllobacterium chamaecytisi TaxID=2876082 RepID=UPI001CCA1F5B|nr:hypothetical protein [Phyllobacterium sp. KW56]MBZ9601693.1 hypothetical protein [Phyllobacterium sp. KW56]
MKEIFETGRPSARDTDQPSPMRRRILKACAYLPTAPLLAMLGGCDGDSGGSGLSGDTSTFTPEQLKAIETEVTKRLNLRIPPFSTTDPVKLPENKLDTLTTGSVEVTHVPDKAPAPSKQKKVGIYSLQYNAFTQISTRKKAPVGTPEGDALAATPGSVEFTVADPNDDTQTITTIYEGIEPYLKRALENRFALVYRAMVTGFQKHSPKEFDVSFFTAPEFYWNVPFSDFLNEAELQVAGDICQGIVTNNVKTLISKFPANQYGNVVMLPGTIATLKATTDAVKSDGTPVGDTVYIASNHLTCTHNLPLNDSKYPRPAYMIWPKRAVSGIDYIDEFVKRNRCGDDGNELMPNPAHPGLRNPIMDCLLSKKSGLTVLIEHVSSSLAQSFDINGNLLSSKFNNRIVEDLPFGVDICLDYIEADVQRDPVRMRQLDEQNFKLDFLIAAGMGLSTSNYANTPFIQYAIRNEGYSGTTGKTEVWKLNWTKGTERSLGKLSKDDVAPLDAASASDTKAGEITVDLTAAFIAPKDADTTGIPNILDEMNAGIVKVWQLDVDQPVEAVVASKTAPVRAIADQTIQFIK